MHLELDMNLNLKPNLELNLKLNLKLNLEPSKKLSGCLECSLQIVVCNLFVAAKNVNSNS